MTLQELLEHAHLDALGQLDEREQAAFEAAFAVAPPAIKAQVRNEQSRWAPMEHLLPQVEPSPELRERVLDAVTAAMVAQGAGELSMRPSRRVAPAWRATSFGLMTAVIGLSAAFVYLNSTIKASTRQQNDDAVQTSVLTAVGRANMMEVLFNPDATRSVLRTGDTTFAGDASIFNSPKWTTSRLFCELPANSAGATYRVVLLDDHNQIDKQIDEFTSSGVSQSRELKVKLTTGMHVALVVAPQGQFPSSEHLLMDVTIA